jgi:hypothetical protein
MKNQIPVEQVLLWRFTQAQHDAPPPPRAAKLLELSRPWWETWPEQFQGLAERLGKVRVADGHALAEPRQVRGGYPVPALIVCGGKESESSARVVYLNIRDGRLRLRFQLNDDDTPISETFEATLVSDKTAKPLLSATASLAVDHEYRMDTELPAELASEWEPLKVIDRMPFRFILRAKGEEI